MDRIEEIRADFVQFYGWRSCVWCKLFWIMSADTFLISLCSLAAAYCFLLLSTASRRLRFETTTPGKHKILFSPARGAHDAFNFAIRERLTLFVGERTYESENPCSAVGKWNTHSHTGHSVCSASFHCGGGSGRFNARTSRDLAARVSNFPVEISRGLFFPLNEVCRCSTAEIATVCGG